MRLQATPRPRIALVARLTGQDWRDELGKHPRIPLRKPDQIPPSLLEPPAVPDDVTMSLLFQAHLAPRQSCRISRLFLGVGELAAQLIAIPPELLEPDGVASPMRGDLIERQTRRQHIGALSWEIAQKLAQAIAARAVPSRGRKHPNRLTPPCRLPRVFWRPSGCKLQDPPAEGAT